MNWLLVLFSFVICLGIEEFYLWCKCNKGIKSPIVLNTVTIAIVVLTCYSMCFSNSIIGYEESLEEIGLLCAIVSWEGFSIIKLLVNSGIHILVIMILFNIVIELVLKLYKEDDNEKSETRKNGIIWVCMMTILFVAICSWLFLDSKEILLTYISILFGKFIWFDVFGLKKIIKEMKLVFIEYGSRLWKIDKSLILLLVIVYISVAIGLIYIKISPSKNAIIDLNCICLGAGLSGFILIIQALIQDKKEKIKNTKC